VVSVSVLKTVTALPQITADHI